MDRILKDGIEEVIEEHSEKVRQQRKKETRTTDYTDHPELVLYVSVTRMKPDCWESLQSGQGGY